MLERLKDTFPELEDVAQETAVKTHLLRLPRRYALDIHNLEDLRTHMTLLQAAQSSGGSVLCDTRGIRLSSTALAHPLPLPCPLPFSTWRRSSGGRR